MGYTALFLVLYGAGFLAFVFESRTLALVAFGALLVQFAVHITAGIVTYRQTMRRPWPKVEPLTDDEDY